MRDQQQFLQVLDRDEAERRFQAALPLAPVGSEFVARSAPDGYTLLYTNTSFTINASAKPSSAPLAAARQLSASRFRLSGISNVIVSLSSPPACFQPLSWCLANHVLLSR